MVHSQLELLVRVHKIHAEFLFEVFEMLDFALVYDAFALKTRVELDLLGVACFYDRAELLL